MLNKVIAMGRLAADAELKSTGSGVSVCSFSIACDRDFKAQDGTRETDWLDCVAWRGTAEFISKYFSKGRMIVVDGRLQTRTYEDKQGNKRKATELVVENAYFGDSKTAGSNETTYGGNDYVGDPMAAMGGSAFAPADGDLDPPF